VGLFAGMPVINRLKPFLDERGITPYRFQKDCRIAVRTAYSLYNLCTQLPSSQVLSKICDTYKVQPGEILEWVEVVDQEVVDDLVTEEID
jgi:DNA-binding Xre family transcriptional regulator